MTQFRAWSISSIYWIQNRHPTEVMFICASYKWRKEGSGPFHTFIGENKSRVSVYRSGDSKESLVDFIHLCDKMFACAKYRWYKAGPGPFYSFGMRKYKFHKNHVYLRNVQVTQSKIIRQPTDPDYLLNVSVRKNKIMLLYATYRWRAAGPGPFHIFMGYKKIMLIRATYGSCKAGPAPFHIFME